METELNYELRPPNLRPRERAPWEATPAFNPPPPSLAMRHRSWEHRGFPLPRSSSWSSMLTQNPKGTSSLRCPNQFLSCPGDQITEGGVSDG